MSEEALEIKRCVEERATLYRGGKQDIQKLQMLNFGLQKVQWRQIMQINMVLILVVQIIFIEGKIKPDTDFITRRAPGLVNNVGGAIEVVTPPNAVDINIYYMIGVINNEV